MSDLEQVDRLAPRQNTAAEAYVIGAALHTAGRSLLDCADLKPSDFYRPAYESLWQTILDQDAAGRPVEPVALMAHLAASPIAGLAPNDLYECMSACQSAHNVRHYVGIVLANARLRRLQQVTSRLLDLASSAAVDDVENAIEQARAQLDEAVAVGASDRLPTFAEAWLEAMDAWAEPPVPALATGWHDLDRVLNGGLRAGHFTIVGARPAVGKSVVASVVAAQVASAGVGVLWASLEMSRTEVITRVAANLADVELDKLENHQLNQHDWERLQHLGGKAQDWALFIDDRPSLSIPQLRKRARDLARTKRGLGLIVVDYLQLMSSPTGKERPRHEQVAAISAGLREMAREFNVPVVALAQVNRNLTSRMDKRPQLSDLRESGTLEQDASEVIMLHRDDEKPGEIDFIVEKNRYGAQCTVTMTWMPWVARIASAERRQMEPVR